MKLKKINIKSFRGIKKLELDLDDVTVLIGENNVGKSTVLEAVRCCLSRPLLGKRAPFGEYDFHLESESARPADADPIEITLTFEERQVDEWTDAVVQALDHALQILPDGRQAVIFQLTGRYDSGADDFVAEWNFLDQASSTPLPRAKSPRVLLALQQIVPVFYVPALRDAAREFRPRSQFWGPFLRGITLDKTARGEIEKQLEELNQKVLDSHQALKNVKTRIADSKAVVPLHDQDPVAVEAVPGRIFDLLSRTQITLRNRLGSRLPIDHHGEGTQSLAVLLLFDAFLQGRLADRYHEDAEPILALEEPEAHLHPSAVWSASRTLEGIGGQKLIASHSGDVVAAGALASLRRLCRRGDDIVSYDISGAGLNTRDIEKIEYHVRVRRGYLMFARCWMLIEGESEFWVIPELAKILGYDLWAEGVTCLEHAQCGIESLIKCADALGILWHSLADGDGQGTSYTKKAQALLPPGSNQADHITQLAERDIEHVFWASGYDQVYETARAGKSVQAAPGTSDYPTQVIKAAISKRSKPGLANDVLAAVRAQGSTGVPATLKASIEAAVKLARGV